MNRKYRGVIGLSVVLLLNIIFTQYTVNNYFYERYELVVLFALLNIAVFPVAYLIYKKEGGR